jgi:AcrR family transcriptional regulator
VSRPRSEDKRNAILDAATEVVAELGISAPTARIAKDAGVAEGTLFTYFATKDELLNQLYLMLKLDLREAMMRGYPSGKSLIERSRHMWNGYVGWESTYPLKRKAMGQLAVSDRVTEKNRKLGSEGFGETHEMLRESLADGALKDRPPAFAAAIMSAIADTTMDFIAKEPEQAKQYTKAGFDAFWKAIAR